MSATKISALVELLGANTADDDLLVIVDKSDTTQSSSGSTKKIKKSELLSVASASDLVDYINSTATTAQTNAITTSEAYTDAPLDLNSQSGNYTFALGDELNVIVEGTGGSAQTFTIPPNSSVAFAIGSAITITCIGAGGITVAAGSGVTINGTNTDLAQGDSRTYYKRNTNVWWGMG